MKMVSLSVTTLNPESTEIYNINQQLITYSETEEVGPDFVPCVSTFWSDVDSGEDEPARILSFKVRITRFYMISVTRTSLLRSFA